MDKNGASTVHVMNSGWINMVRLMIYFIVDTGKLLLRFKDCMEKLFLGNYM
jgi:DMSO/TMAO reductase YedYZ heme-binding membrane subunit